MEQNSSKFGATVSFVSFEVVISEELGESVHVSPEPPILPVQMRAISLLDLGVRIDVIEFEPFSFFEEAMLHGLGLTIDQNGSETITLLKALAPNLEFVALRPKKKKSGCYWAITHFKESFTVFMLQVRHPKYDEELLKKIEGVCTFVVRESD